VDLGRSVGCAGYLPTWRRADDSGCSKEAVEGNDVKHAPQSVCARRKHERSLHALRGRVLRSVLRLVLVNPHYALGASRVVGRTSRHHGWANPGNREEPALGSARTDEARLVACHRRRKAKGVACREQEDGRGRRPYEDQRVEVWLPARRSAVAEVGRRRLVSNKLGIRAPKRAVRVE
jgi:hypothetical protein